MENLFWFTYSVLNPVFTLHKTSSAKYTTIPISLLLLCHMKNSWFSCVGVAPNFMLSWSMLGKELLCSKQNCLCRTISFLQTLLHASALFAFLALDIISTLDVPITLPPPSPHSLTLYFFFVSSFAFFCDKLLFYWASGRGLL